MESVKYYLSEYGNIWCIDDTNQSVYCNNICVTPHFEISTYPACEVGECLDVEDHHTGRNTESMEIIELSSKISKEQCNLLIQKLGELKELYGPLSLKNENGKIVISVFLGDGNIEKQDGFKSFIPKYLEIGTIDFKNGEITLNNDLAIEGNKLQAQENWKNIKDIIELFDSSRTFNFELYDDSLNDFNQDLSDAKVENAYLRVTEKKVEKGVDIIIKQNER